MAVLDATEWFDLCKTDEERERDLVLQQYPLASVREIQGKLGAATFFHSDSVQAYFSDGIAQLNSTPRATPSPLGSMIPFGPGFPSRTRT